ncbi:hypothetical protein C8J38_102651 [Rhizobium sp. PP-WC-2G-219]|nr:hypothetical protein C8J32_102896 [Rhizobium sp. PP-CC-3A-592]TCL94219.1 hypothetical protein C8J38_102651 [Rhizobium sp. PP-WC-2G-219]
MLEAWKQRPRRGVDRDDYRAFMIRELLVWLVGVPVPIAMVIGVFVL